jgi:hypothetical protein
LHISRAPVDGPLSRKTRGFSGPCSRPPFPKKLFSPPGLPDFSIVPRPLSIPAPKPNNVRPRGRDAPPMQGQRDGSRQEALRKQSPMMTEPKPVIQGGACPAPATRRSPFPRPSG